MLIMSTKVIQKRNRKNKNLSTAPSQETLLGVLGASLIVWRVPALATLVHGSWSYVDTSSIDSYGVAEVVCTLVIIQLCQKIVSSRASRQI